MGWIPAVHATTHPWLALQAAPGQHSLAPWGAAGLATPPGPAAAATPAGREMRARQPLLSRHMDSQMAATFGRQLPLEAPSGRAPLPGHSPHTRPGQCSPCWRSGRWPGSGTRCCNQSRRCACAPGSCGGWIDVCRQAEVGKTKKRQHSPTHVYVQKACVACCCMRLSGGRSSIHAPHAAPRTCTPPAAGPLGPACPPLALPRPPLPPPAAAAAPSLPPPACPAAASAASGPPSPRRPLRCCAAAAAAAAWPAAEAQQAAPQRCRPGRLPTAVGRLVLGQRLQQ